MIRTFIKIPVWHLASRFKGSEKCFWKIPLPSFYLSLNYPLQSCFLILIKPFASKNHITVNGWAKATNLLIFSLFNPTIFSLEKLIIAVRISLTKAFLSILRLIFSILYNPGVTKKSIDTVNIILVKSKITLRNFLSVTF